MPEEIKYIPVVTQSASQWVPIVGTLGGAMIGFFSNYLINLMNAKRNEKLEKENKKKEGLKDLYETLILVCLDYSSISSKCIEKIDSNVKFEFDKKDKIAPLVKAEMLVNIYGKEVMELWDELKKETEKFGNILLEVIEKNYNEAGEDVKKDVRGRVIQAMISIRKKVEKIHSEIVRIVSV